MSFLESLFKRRTVEPGPSPTREEIDSQRDRHGCNVCADKGERTIDNKLASNSSKPKHSLRPQDQWTFTAPGTVSTPNDTLPALSVLPTLTTQITSETTLTSITPPTTTTTPSLTPPTTTTTPSSTPIPTIQPATFQPKPAVGSTPDCECLAYQNSVCPLNRRELGRSSWAFLHTLAANYPEKPTIEEQDRMAKFVFTYAELYPCGYCADYTKYHMMRHPPEVKNRKEFQFWMCGVHNEVNYRMQKPLFNCDYLDQRWGAGPADGSCGETQL